MTEYPGDEYTYLHDQAAKRLPDEPEYTIRMEVLLESLNDLKSPRTRMTYQRAASWLRGEEPCHPGYSFEDICDLFDLSPEAIREELVARGDL